MEQRPTLVYLDGKDDKGHDVFAILEDYNKPYHHFSLCGIKDGFFLIEVDRRYIDIYSRIAGCFKEGSNFRRDCSNQLGLSRFDTPPKGIMVKQGFRQVRILAKDKPNPTRIRNMLRTHSKKPGR